MFVRGLLNNFLNNEHTPNLHTYTPCTDQEIWNFYESTVMRKMVLKFFQIFINFRELL